MKPAGRRRALAQPALQQRQQLENSR